MAGGRPNPQGNNYTHNDAAFVEYNTRLQSSNLPTFTSATSKFTEWLRSDKAYYPNARVPIVSIIESAHTNICRVQGDLSVPFKLDKALPGLDLWYQPYLSLLKQVGTRLNHFEPELRARLQFLVENAGIKIVQVPTLAENTGSQRKSLPPTEPPTGANDNASSQASSPSNQIQQYGTAPPVTNPGPPRKGRRKLNRTIFEIDTAAALRTNTQAAPRIVEANGPPLPEVTVRQEATDAVHPSDPLPEGPLENAPAEGAPDVGNLAEERLHVQSKDSGRTRIEIFRLSEEVTDVEGSSANSPQEAEPGNNTNLRDHKDRLERLEPPTADSEEVETNNAGGEPPGPPDSHPKTTPGPVVMESSMVSLVSAPRSEEAGLGRGVGASERPQAVFWDVEQDAGNEAPSHTLNKIATHGVVRRRDSEDSVGEERSRTSLEPLAKRIRRTKPEATTMMALPMLTSRAATPEVSARDPSGLTTSVASVTLRIQRSSSDMILEPNNETTPPLSSNKGAADDNGVRGDGAQSSEQNPPPGTTSEPQTGAPTVDHGKQVVGETGTPMPPLQDPSPAPPGTKPNPFTESRMLLRPSDVPPSLVRSTAIPVFGRLSVDSPAVRDVLSRGSTALASQLRQESQTQKAYVFSAAEIRTLVASRGSDEGSGPNKLVFYLDWGLMSGISKWRNFKAGQGPLEGSFCLSLACYPVDSVAPLMSTATEKQPFDALIMQARIKSTWPSDPGFRSTLKDGSGKSYAIPPFLITNDNFVDISESAIPGTNTYTIEDNGQSLSNWLFAVYIHTPTIAYFDAVKARIDKTAKWVETLKSFTMYSLPAVDWDVLQPQDPS